MLTERTDAVPRRWLRYLLQVAGSFLLFAALNRFGSYFQIENGVSVFYPATAVDILACMYFGWRGAVAVILGTLFTPWHATDTWVTLTISGFLNAAEGMIPYLFFRAQPSLHKDLRDGRSLLWFLAVGTLLNSLFSATLGNLLLIPGPLRARQVFTWWAADFSAALLIATPLLAFAAPVLRWMNGEKEHSSRTFRSAVQVTMAVVLLGWFSSAAIRNVLVGSLDRERTTQEARRTEVTAILGQVSTLLTHGEGPSAARRAQSERLIARLQTLTRSPVEADLVRDLSVAVDDEDGMAAARAMRRLRTSSEQGQQLAWNSYQAKSRRIRFVSLVLDMLVLTILVLASLNLVLAISRPLRQMRNGVAALRTGSVFDASSVSTNLVELRTLAAALDDTSHRLQERERELVVQTERAMAGSQAKSDFLAKMSHELRTPLNSIVGFSELLIERSEEITPAKRRAFAENILRSGQTLLRLINDLLDISKVESGKMQFTFEEADVRSIVRGTVASTIPLFDSRRQMVELMMPEEPVVACVDAARIEQALLNLLSNANKFASEGDTIVVSCRSDRAHVEIAVADHGVGIRSEDQEKIFEEFEQGSGHRPMEGTGLGLAIARRLVEAHAGTLEVDSQPGSGAVFTIRMPLAAPQVAA